MQIGVSVPGVTLMPDAAESWAAEATADDMLRVWRGRPTISGSTFSAFPSTRSCWIEWSP